MFSFFNKKGKTEDNISLTDFNWLEFNDIDSLKEFIKTTNSVLLFKHSTRCYTSKSVLKQFENQYINTKDICFVFVYVIEQRALSNEITDFTNIVHQSPQTIAFKEGKVVGSESHYSIIEKDWKSLF